MLIPEDIKTDAAVNDIEPGQIVRIVTTDPVGESALTVYYKTAYGQVKEQMLPKQPLRFVLADEPGAGKTIMAGLLIRELLMRAESVLSEVI